MPKPVFMFRLPWGFGNHHFFQFTDLLYFFAQKNKKDHTRTGCSLSDRWPWALKASEKKCFLMPVFGFKYKFEHIQFNT